MDSLPEELIDAIFEIVAASPRKNRISTGHMQHTFNLHPLMLVSKKFSRIAAPLLYRDIQAPHWLAAPFWKSIVTTLKCNPALAHHVRSIATPPSNPAFARDKPKDLRADLSWDLVSDMHHQSLRDFERRSKMGDNVMLAFLVLQAPRLETLDLRGFVVGGRSSRSNKRTLPLAVEEFGRMIYAHVDEGANLGRFDCLRTLWLELQKWDYFPAGAVLPFLALPHLKSLTLDHWGGERDSWEIQRDLYGSVRNWPLRTSSVEELYLYCVGAGATMVSKLLKSCKALKVFECTVDRYRDKDKDMRQWHRQVSATLTAEHSSTLERLCIDESWNHAWEDAGWRKDCFQNTSCLIKLKDLRIPYSVLVDNDRAIEIPPHRAFSVPERIPTSLERLVLSIDRISDESIWEEVDHIVNHISNAICDAYLAGSLPHLKGVEIELNGPYFPCGVPAFDIEAFRSILHARGVQLDVSVASVLIQAEDDHEFMTLDMMLALKSRCPAFAQWGQKHCQLKASSRDKPCIPRRPGMPWSAEDDPYSPVYNPWDYENDPPYWRGCNCQSTRYK